MIISLCGDLGIKKIIIEEMEKKYKDKIVVCDYFQIMFNTVIDNERIKYQMLDNCSCLIEARKLFQNHVNKIVSDKINFLLEHNKNKIVLLITDNILTADIDKTDFFNKSDLKILAIDELDESEVYDKTHFDYIFNRNEKINIKRVLKL